jgi:hypothetical protein
MCSSFNWWLFKKRRKPPHQGFVRMVILSSYSTTLRSKLSGRFYDPSDSKSCDSLMEIVIGLVYVRVDHIEVTADNRGPTTKLTLLVTGCSSSCGPFRYRSTSRCYRGRDGVNKHNTTITLYIQFLWLWKVQLQPFPCTVYDLNPLVSCTRHGPVRQIWPKGKSLTQTEPIFKI